MREFEEQTGGTETTEAKQPAETQEKEESRAEQEGKAVHRTKKRTILGPGQTAR
ncbi:MAG: hypothetical protein R3C24_12155 [Cyanobacteriota/Melainabacteria group bacterium]